MIKVWIAIKREWNTLDDEQKYGWKATAGMLAMAVFYALGIYLGYWI